jgi:hypothetical protein
LVLCASAGPVLAGTTNAGAEDVADASIVGRRLEETGAWRTKMQQLFDPKERTLVRRRHTVWDPEPSRNLDFVWVPDVGGEDAEGLVSGQGRLIWRIKGRPAYDPESIFAEFRGSMKDGREHGHGTYSDRGGLLYEGGWKNGVMEGQGRLKLPNGDEYVGPFWAGKANGSGRYVDVTGETFEGPFVDGMRDGEGTTKLPNGLSYRSTWMAGEESEASRAVRLSQAGGRPSSGGLDEVRIAVEVDPNYSYVASSIGPLLSIRPGEQVFNAWKGDGDISSAPSLQFEDSPVGLPLRLGIQNRSTRALQIAGAYLDVESSVTELQPAVYARVGRTNGCGAYLYEPKIIFQNFGWSPAENGTLRLALASSNATVPSEKPSLSLSKRLGQIDRAVTVDLEPDLRALGVDTGFLMARANGVLPCKSKSDKACLQELKSSGIFGSLAQLISNEDAISVDAIGTLEYVWTDHKGEKKRRVSKVTATLALGHLHRPDSRCAEEAGPEIVLPKPLNLRLDQSRYRLPIVFPPRALPAARITRLVLPVKAARSSQHEFRVVVQMADGTEVSSRPVRLLYYVPSWSPRL